MANLFLFCEPLTGWRAVSVTEWRARTEWAAALRDLSDRHYSAAERITVVLDNLNTHGPAFFYEAFPPEQARRLAERFACPNRTSALARGRPSCWHDNASA